MRIFKKTASITQCLAIPAICVVCSQYFYEKLAVCSACLKLMPELSFGCDICKLPLKDSSYRRCGACIRHPPAFDKVIAGYIYSEPLRSIVHKFKYQSALFLKKFLAELMLESMKRETIKIGCIIPVPMHNIRIKQKGFNPALELAKVLAQQKKVPLQANLCRKKINTATQVSLSVHERLDNLKNAFSAETSAYPEVTLVDDVLTTGSTANEIAKTLKARGVHRVNVWCLARAV